MDKEIPKPPVLKLAVTEATVPSPGGGGNRDPKKKRVAAIPPVLEAGATQGQKEPKLAKSNQNFAWLTKDTGSLLRTIDATQLQASTTPVSSSAGFQLLCTYNWASAPSPVIYVPGGPAQWSPVTLPITLPNDSGTHFIDQNAFRAPTYPFEPVFAALDLMNPDFDFGGVDLVTNRNSLRKLLDFASGRVPGAFRIDINLVQDTLFLTRREKSTWEVVQGPRNTGYGRNFEHAFTKHQQGLENSSGHHRVARYMMGELSCVVRFEVDAWCGVEVEGEGTDEERASNFEGRKLASEVGFDKASGSVPTNIMKLNPRQDASLVLSGLNQEEGSGQQAEAVVEKLKQLSMDDSKERKKVPQYKPTHVIPRGCIAPCSTLAEIKAKKDKVKLAETLPQLWFGRTPLLLYATHEKGTFKEEVQRINAGERFQDWEAKQQQVLRQMVWLIGELRDIARAAKGGTCVAVCEKKSRPLKLEVFESTTKKGVLPEEIIERYWQESQLPSE